MLLLRSLLLTGALAWPLGPALADRDHGDGHHEYSHDHGGHGNNYHGAPGPVMGAGVVGWIAAYGVYRLVRRRKNTDNA